MGSSSESPIEPIPIPLPAAAVWHELNGLDRFDVLQPDEILIEVEAAYRRPDDEPGFARLGALIVTDHQVVFIATTTFRRRIKELVSIPLTDVVTVDTTMRPVGFRKWPTLEIEADVDGHIRTFAFPLDVKVRSRAAEIATSIRSEQQLLAGRLDRRESTPEQATSLESVVDEVPVDVHVGRGVASYVRANGGRLYVWATPLGKAFESVHASLARPPGQEFRPATGIRDFELFIEPGVWSSRGLRLVRRWWGLRGGISVDTGLVLDGDS